MITGIEKFNRDLNAISKGLLPEEVALVQKKISFDILKSVVERTPVDTGRARGGWQVSIGSLPVVARKAKDKNGAKTMSDGAAKLSKLPSYQIVFISNAVEYIEILENGGFVPRNPGPTKDFKRRKVSEGSVLVRNGFSVQAPGGMLAISIESARLKFGAI